MVKKILLFAALSFSGLANAQIPVAPVSVQSPNAASLGTYGEVPVSLYTGLPNIDVPLHMVQQGSTSIPISLSYHASGFRPDEHPGWVGMGWTLNSGGAITRRVNDLPDEYNNSSMFNNTYGPQGGGNAGFYFISSIVNVANWSSTAYMQNITRSTAVYRDTQPDEFSFNFMGYSGKFYKDTDANGTWKVRCNKPVKVTLHAVNPFLPVNFAVPPKDAPAYDRGYSPSFGGFTVTTEDGTQYVFGGSSEAIEYSVGIFSQNTSEWVANSWYLTKIIPVSGQEVNLTYAHDSYISQMYIAVYERLNYKTRDSGGFFTNTYSCSGSEISNSVSSFFTGTLVRPVYLVSIEDASQTVWFDRSNTTELRYPFGAYDKAQDNGFGNRRLPFLQNKSYSLTITQCTDKLIWKKLDQIRVVAKNGRQIKKFNLHYTDNPTNPNAASQRLALLRVTESSDAAVAKPPYEFNYYNDLQNLPGYLANQNDHWGFYNAMFAPIATPSDLDAYFSNRNPNPNPSIFLAGMLTKITYPTGGVTEFDYKQHHFSQQVAENRAQPLVSLANNPVAGGVCIAKISSYSLDNPGQKNEKEYFYVTGYSTTANVAQLPCSGVLAGQTKYYFNDYRASAYDRPNVDYQMTVFSSQSVLPASSNGQGGHIGYSQVVEKRTDGSYTKYSFTNFDNGHADEAATNTLQFDRTAYEPYSLREQERGLVLQEQSFNNQDVIVKAKNVQYVRIAPSAPATDYVKSLKADFFNTCSNSWDAIEQATAYKIYTYSYSPVLVSETVYDASGNNGLTNTSSTTYNSYNLPTSVTTITSKGQTLLTAYSYPWDAKYTYTSDVSDPVAHALSTMRERNMLKYPVETVVSNNGNVVAATVQTFNQYGAFGNNIQPYQTFHLTPATAVPVATYNGLNVNTGQQPSGIDNPPAIVPPLKTTVVGYDQAGNATGVENEGVQRTSYLWDYGKTLLVAKADNAASNQIAYAGFEADVNGQFVGNSYVTLNPNNWDFDPRSGGLTHLQPAGGLTGRACYRLDGGWGVGRGNLPAGDYEVSFWAKGGNANIWVFATQELSRYEGPANTNQLDYRLVRVRVRVASGSGINIDAYGRQVDIDDVRLYPVGAQMTTYTHEPVVGVTSTSDVNCRPTFYEYDGLQRLKVIRDAEGNIVKHLEYHYQQ